MNHKRKKHRDNHFPDESALAESETWLAAMGDELVPDPSPLSPDVQTAIVGRAVEALSAAGGAVPTASSATRRRSAFRRGVSIAVGLAAMLLLLMVPVRFLMPALFSEQNASDEDRMPEAGNLLNKDEMMPAETWEEVLPDGSNPIAPAPQYTGAVGETQSSSDQEPPGLPEADPNEPEQAYPVAAMIGKVTALTEDAVTLAASYVGATMEKLPPATLTLMLPRELPFVLALGDEVVCFLMPTEEGWEIDPALAAPDMPNIAPLPLTVIPPLLTVIAPDSIPSTVEEMRSLLSGFFQ